ncbi:protein kinase [Myxococcota bacterium]|nr:protein kinase [Myxococcota bacterium]MBU1534686.1 protein kinase [Myxococcota bacterium]
MSDKVNGDNNSSSKDGGRLDSSQWDEFDIPLDGVIKPNTHDESNDNLMEISGSAEAVVREDSRATEEISSGPVVVSADIEEEPDEAAIQTLMAKKDGSLQKRRTKPNDVKNMDEATHKLAMDNTMALFKGKNNLPAGEGPADSHAYDEGPLTGIVFEGKYKVGKVLGEGGMGIVYKATHIMMKKEVALKILLPVLGTKLDMIERFRREAESAARLNNANIVNVLDFGRSEDGTFYLVMDYADGVSLSEILLEGPMNWKRACRLMGQILDGLQAAHDNGIVHRDLKPDNIMVIRSEGGREVIKILDFGIAKLSQPEGEGLNLTRMGMVFGTPSYISPEQAQGKIVTHGADIYSAGVIFFQMITGRLPFQGDSTIDLINKHINEPPPRPTSIIKNIPMDLEILILQSLAKDPKERPKTAYEMKAYIGNQLQVTTFKTTIPIQTSSRFQDFFFTALGKIFMILVVLGVLGGVAAYFFYPTLFKFASNKEEKKVGKSTGTMDAMVGAMGITKKVDSVLFKLISDGKFEEAIKLAELDVEKNPSDVKAAKTLTMVRRSIVEKGLKNANTELASLMNNNELDMFIKKVREWSAWFPTDADIHYILAMAYYRRSNHSKSLASLNKALLLKPSLKAKNITAKHIARYFSHKNQWVRTTALKLIKETYAAETADKLTFFVKVVNDNKVDADDRYRLFLFLKEKGATKGVVELELWKHQLLFSTLCNVRLQASIWYQKNGTKEDLEFLRAMLKKHYFLTGSGNKASVACYSKELTKAYNLAKRRKKRP